MGETLLCCHPVCLAAAEFGILGQGDTPDLETHACKDHLGDAIGPGVNQVWPLK